MADRAEPCAVAWIGWPMWFAFWYVVIELLMGWSGRMSTAAFAGVISGVLMCAMQEWRVHGGTRRGNPGDDTAK